MINKPEQTTSQKIFDAIEALYLSSNSPLISSATLRKTGWMASLSNPLPSVSDRKQMGSSQKDYP